MGYVVWPVLKKYSQLFDKSSKRLNDIILVINCLNVVNIT